MIATDRDDELLRGHHRHDARPRTTSGKQSPAKRRAVAKGRRSAVSDVPRPRGSFGVCRSGVALNLAVDASVDTDVEGRLRVPGTQETPGPQKSWCRFPRRRTNRSSAELRENFGRGACVQGKATELEADMAP